MMTTGKLFGFIGLPLRTVTAQTSQAADTPGWYAQRLAQSYDASRSRRESKTPTRLVVELLSFDAPWRPDAARGRAGPRTA